MSVSRDYMDVNRLCGHQAVQVTDAAGLDTPSGSLMLMTSDSSHITMST
jgi:hypothetical protein